MKSNKSEIKKIKKLIIPAAGWGTRFLPMTKIIHKELVPILDTPVIDRLVDEALESGIEEILIVLSDRKVDLLNFFRVDQDLQTELILKGKKDILAKVKKTNRSNYITKVIQKEQHGLGHALATCKEFLDNEPFAIILGDDLIKAKTPAIKQLINFYNQTGANVIGVQSVDREYINKYGIVNPINSKEKDNKYFEIDGAVEKPSPEKAPSNKAILGRYVFNYEILEILSKIEYDGKNEIQVVDAFDELMRKYNQKIYAYEFEGTRYDLGSMEGFVKANIDYALEEPQIAEQIKEFIKQKNKEI
ncbi:sugar phosphate nucleotidyltransferase [Mycoplasmopsis caviae]|uniref:UTP--glucose-1-phosphate uridylyltransferase n=1 Tax=Mycoplasmopsis caviae TaxID=55603 RepID=A0A3P8MET9_9BACT|nr:sugar phosphate nucleotidyltransferase [Mycoplasmopsis caviae]UUD34857.1 sugar phosphate nucleotidyltransferase [Mycoplasmopsis caviae]VDR42296.1 UTP--glucose-1-phosphate uridylyltransferase [Mycoplasmopsis caviae]